MWQALDAALRDLEGNRDVALLAARSYVIGYLTRAVAVAHGGAPAFTGDDYQLLADAAYREEDRCQLFERYHGIPAPADDQLERLSDLARRVGDVVRPRDAGPDAPGAAT